MKPVLIIDCYLDDEPGAQHYACWLSRPHHAYRAPRGESPPPLDQIGGIVITGSKGCLSDPEPWMHEVAHVVRSALSQDIPILGCCFGHQMLAWVVAGPDSVVQTTLPEVGFPTVEVLYPDPILHDLGSSFAAFATHQDAVVPSATLRVLARTEACEVHAIRIPGRRAWGVQFHVEYPPEEQARILRYRAEKHPELGLDPDALMARAPDTRQQAAALFAAFERQLDS